MSKKRARSVARSKSGSINQRYGSSDPDPNQNVMDFEHCSKTFEGVFFLNIKLDKITMGCGGNQWTKKRQEK
jgi:hypothetical protein